MTEYKFYRESSGQWETVQPERWQWVVQYTDGTLLRQFDPDSGLFHQFNDIDQSRIHSFSMVCEGLPPFIIAWNPAYKLIHFYMNYIFDANGPNQHSYRVYCFGYQHNGTKTIMCIMPDNGIVVTDDVNKIKVM